MRQRVMRIRNADLGVRAITRLASQLERNDSGNVPLQREQLKIEHQTRVLSVGGRNSDRAIDIGNRVVFRSGFCLLDSALDVTNRFKVLLDAIPIAGSQRRLQTSK